jgi:hypothetical protein
MFPGFPHFCRRGAKIPIAIPTPMIPQRPAKMFFMVAMPFSFLSSPVLDPVMIDGYDAVSRIQEVDAAPGTQERQRRIAAAGQDSTPGRISRMFCERFENFELAAE